MKSKTRIRVPKWIVIPNRGCFCNDDEGWFVQEWSSKDNCYVTKTKTNKISAENILKALDARVLILPEEEVRKK